MKTIFTLIAILLLSNLLMAQTTAIPDTAFEKALIDLGYDTGTPDGTVPTSNINTVPALDVSSKDITNLTGIEAFTALNSLNCSYNGLNSINVANNTALTMLDCSSNAISSLDISKNTTLAQLYCNFNSLSSLDVSTNTKLTLLSCGYNSLNSLNLSGNTKLNSLSCYNNSLSSIDLSNNTAITELRCFNNSLSSLDVSNNTALIELRCYNNPLSSLDISNNTALKYLECSSNSLSNLDVTNNVALLEVACGSNTISSLDVSNNTQLTDIYCSNNNISSLDVSKNTKLIYLSCGKNSLNYLDIRNGNNTNMTDLHALDNPSLFCILVDDTLYSNSNWTSTNYEKDTWANYRSGSCNPTSISTFAKDDLLNISIFPNPSKDYIIVKGINKEFKQLRIFDVLGREVIKQTLSASSQQEVNIEELIAGSYFIHLEKENGESYVFKALK